MSLLLQILSKTVADVIKSCQKRWKVFLRALANTNRVEQGGQVFGGKTVAGVNHVKKDGKVFWRAHSPM